MKRAEKKASNKLVGIMIALAAVVVIVAGFIFFNPFGGGNLLAQLKRQLVQAQPNKQLNMNQVKKKKII